MEIETLKAVKLFFSKSSLPLVYFEALANSLDAGATEVTIEIDIQSFNRPETLKISISDNGDGFNNDNFDRFKTLLKPRDEFHKGIGRLVFLNYFKRVEIKSVWDGNQRQFVFQEGFQGDAPIQNAQHGELNNTTLIFTGFKNRQIHTYDDLKPVALKHNIIAQFLPKLYAYKRADKAFTISITLNTHDSNDRMDFGSDAVTIQSSDLPQLTCVPISDQQLDAFATINMYYNIQAETKKGSSLIAFIIDGRTISVNLIPPSAFPADYRCIFLFESELFQADSSRQKLVLPDETQRTTLEATLRRELGKVLAENIPQIAEKNKKTRDLFETQFPHLLGYFDDDSAGLIDPNESLTNAQQRFFKDQKKILQCEALNDTDYEKSLELSSRTLMEYILYRNKIINRMKKMTPDNIEADLHKLIVPMRRTFSGNSLHSVSAEQRMAVR